MPDAGRRAPVRRRPLVHLLRAVRAACREPPADRAGRAAPRARAHRADGRDRGAGRPSSRTRWTCCSAAARARGSCARARRRPGSKGSSSCPTSCATTLGDRLPPDAEELVLARRVSAEGRTRAYLAGRSATVADLRDVGGELIAFYGQHEHRKLMLASAQLAILDGFCGDEHLERRAAFAALFARARALEASLDELRERAGARERELDLLEYELGEIDAAAPDEAEEAELLAARSRLRHVEALGAAALGASEAVLAEADAGTGSGVSALLAAGGARPRRRRRRRPGPRRARRALARAGVRGRRPRRRSCAATPTGSRRSRARSRPPRSASPSSTGSSASTAARSPRCSPTPSAAASDATS